MYKKLSTGWQKHLDFMVLDIICLQLAFVMGYFLRHHSFNPYGSPIYSHSDFHEISALHDVFEGIVKKHDHQLDQSEYDSLISVNWASIWIKTVMS